MGWKWGCQPYSCRCWQNVMHCRKEICSTCLFKESIPAIAFGNSKHPLPARSRFLRAAACFSSCALWWHFACKRSLPFVEDSGFVSHAEKHRSRSCGLQGCAFSDFPCRLLQCVSWKGYQPLSCLCDALPRGIFFDMFV